MIHHVDEAEPRQRAREWKGVPGKAEPFRTSGGKAACTPILEGHSRFALNAGEGARVPSDKVKVSTGTHFLSR